MPPISSPVVTMGSFDGVHAGHRVIISRLKQLAHNCGGETVLITFHPHPRKVLYPESAGKDLRLISTMEERYVLLEDAGLDHLLILEFTKEFSRTSPEDYIRDILVARLKAHTIVVGFNHFFGHKKGGNFDSLYQMSRELGFEVEEIPEQEIQNETVSSTKIRKALEEGHIQRANAYLEHRFLVKAVLFPVQGHLRAEVSDSDKLIPPEGAYAASFGWSNTTYKALVRIRAGELYLYPLEDQEIPQGKMVSLLFQKHLAIQGNLEREMHEVQELIF